LRWCSPACCWRAPSTKHNPHVAAALRKLAITLPQPLTAHLKRAAERVQAHSAGERHVAVLEALADGWGNGRKVRIEYRSPRSGALRQRLVAPYALEPTASGIYLIGHDDWAGDIRTFKLDRLEHATVLAEPFTLPEDFDLEAFLESGWRIMAGEESQEVVLRFTATASAHVAERSWHPSQTLEALPEGGCLLTVCVAEPLEMQPWIRSWGAQVEVVAPWLAARADRSRAGTQAAAHLRRDAEPRLSAGPAYDGLNVQVYRINNDLAELLFNPAEVDLRVGETLTLRERESGRSVIAQVIAFRSATYPFPAARTAG
jgi:hypothetical protein